jgi:hypothetical protein
MPKLELDLNWQLKVTPRELNLIRRALGGRITPEEYSEASALDLALAKQTVAQTKERIAVVDTLEKNLKEK